MANEENDFFPFVDELAKVLTKLKSGTVYFIVDKVSVDNTLKMCRNLSEKDNRFITIWAPENKHIVDAYLKGYEIAFNNGHDIIIEMDAGFSHDPNALPMFIRTLNEGNECAFGSRFISGGSIYKSSWYRTFLSKTGTIISNLILGSSLRDMTSGYQGFKSSIVKEFLEYGLKSKAHFYQTELRYLLRKKRFIEVPIHYRSPSPSVSRKAITNSVSTLSYYIFLRLSFRAPIID